MKEKAEVSTKSAPQGRLHRVVRSALLLGAALTLANAAFAANGSQIPIAYGSVSAIGGTLQSGTTNVSSTLDSATGLFEIKIADVCFDRLNYTVVATVSGYNGWPVGAAFINTNDDGDSCHATGKLYVQLLDVNGTVVQDDFQFVVFQAK